MNLIYITDRSRIDTREECERKRYLQYDYDIDGAMLGLQRRTASLPLLNGTEIHEAHAQVLAHAAGLPGGLSVNDAVASMRDRYTTAVTERGIHGEADVDGLVREQMALLEAMLRMFVILWVPRILEEYVVVNLEKQLDWQLAPGLVQKLRFDVLLRRKGDGQLIILDYKSMSYHSDGWARRLERSRQTSLYITAAQELYGEKVEIAYLGMAKGAWRKDLAKSSPFYEQKIQSTPYLYAYALKGEIGTVYESEYTAKKGFVKVRTYDEMPLVEWIEWLVNNRPAQMEDLFQFVPPFAPTPTELNRVRELVVREELAYVKNIRLYEGIRKEAIANNDLNQLQQAQDFLDYVAAPMRENTCAKYGEQYMCPMYGICFTEGGLENILEEGVYEPREPHHGAVELEAA